MIEWRRPRLAIAAFAAVITAGTIGYLILGFGALDAIYQTVTTVTTVGFREVQPLSSNGKIFTIVLIVLGVGTAFYGLTVVMETVLEGELPELFGRRRMERRITGMRDHVVVCGWGRVGQAIVRDIEAMGGDVVVIDRDAERMQRCDHPSVVGDATEDETLRQAGMKKSTKRSRQH